MGLHGSSSDVSVFLNQKASTIATLGYLVLGINRSVIALLTCVCPLRVHHCTVGAQDNMWVFTLYRLFDMRLLAFSWADRLSPAACLFAALFAYMQYLTLRHGVS